MIYRADKEDDEIFYANKEFLDLAGYENLDALFKGTKKSFRNLIREDQQKTVEASIWNQIESGSKNDYIHYQLRRQDGTYIPVLDQGRIVESERFGRVFYVLCTKLIEISRKDRRTNDRHCVLYSPLFFRKITPSVLPEHLFWGRNAGRAWLFLVYMKTRKKSNPEPCFSRKSLKPAPGSIQNPFQNQKRPDRPARFRGTVWPRIQLTGFMLAGSSTGTG